MILMTNSPYELPLDNMKNITTEISDEQNLALSIKLNGAIVVPAVKHTVRISYYAAYHPWAETFCCLHYSRNCFSNDWNNNNYWSNRRPKWHKKTVSSSASSYSYIRWKCGCGVNVGCQNTAPQLQGNESVVSQAAEQVFSEEEEQ